MKQNHKDFNPEISPIIPKISASMQIKMIWTLLPLGVKKILINFL